MTLIAGHSFADAIGGRACTACGKLWVQIASATEDDIGQLGIAHTGALNDAELKQIAAERERIWAAVMEAAG